MVKNIRLKVSFLLFLGCIIFASLNAITMAWNPNASDYPADSSESLDKNSINSFTTGIHGSGSFDSDSINRVGKQYYGLHGSSPVAWDGTIPDYDFGRTAIEIRPKYSAFWDSFDSDIGGGTSTRNHAKPSGCSYQSTYTISPTSASISTDYSISECIDVDSYASSEDTGWLCKFDAWEYDSTSSRRAKLNDGTWYYNSDCSPVWGARAMARGEVCWGGYSSRSTTELTLKIRCNIETERYWKINGMTIMMGMADTEYDTIARGHESWGSFKMCQRYTWVDMVDPEYEHDSNPNDTDRIEPGQLIDEDPIDEHHYINQEDFWLYEKYWSFSGKTVNDIADYFDSDRPVFTFKFHGEGYSRKVGMSTESQLCFTEFKVKFDMSWDNSMGVDFAEDSTTARQMIKAKSFGGWNHPSHTTGQIAFDHSWETLNSGNLQIKQDGIFGASCTVSYSVSRLGWKSGGSSTSHAKNFQMRQGGSWETIAPSGNRWYINTNDLNAEAWYTAGVGIKFNFRCIQYESGYAGMLFSYKITYNSITWYRNAYTNAYKGSQTWSQGKGRFIHESWTKLTYNDAPLISASSLNGVAINLRMLTAHKFDIDGFPRYDYDYRSLGQSWLGKDDCSFDIAWDCEGTIPTIESTHKATNGLEYSDIRFEVGGSDNFGVRWAYVFINGGTYALSYESSSGGIAYFGNSFKFGSGTYSYYYMVRDYSGNWITSKASSFKCSIVTVEIEITNLEDYKEGTTENYVNFTISDHYGGTWEVFLNDESIEEGTWEGRGGDFSVNLDGLYTGEYTVRIEAENIYGRSTEIEDTFIVSESETIIEIIELEDYMEGAIDNNVTFFINGISGDWYKVFINEVLNYTGSWIQDDIISVNLDGYHAGLQNITIIANNTYGRFDILETNFTVIPSVVEILVTQLEPYEIGTMGHNLIFNISGLIGNEYYVYIDGYLRYWGNWLDENGTGDEKIHSIDGFQLGYHDVYIYANNSYGRENNVTVRFVVRTSPVFLSTPEDYIELGEGTGNHTLTWVILDDNPSIYTIYQNGIVVQSNNYQNNVEVNYIVELDNITQDFTHTFLLIAEDYHGSILSDELEIHIYPINPIIEDLDNFAMREDETIEVIWEVVDNNLERWIVEYYSTSFGWKNYSEGYFNSSEYEQEVKFYLDGTDFKVNLETNFNTFDFRLTIYDTNGNSDFDIINVSIYHNLPILSDVHDGYYFSDDPKASLVWHVRDNNLVRYWIEIERPDGLFITIQEGDISNYTEVDITLDLYNLRIPSGSLDLPEGKLVKLETGKHNIIIYVEDSFGNIVLDPVQVDNRGERAGVEFNMGGTISWIATIMACAMALYTMDKTEYWERASEKRQTQIKWGAGIITGAILIIISAFGFFPVTFTKLPEVLQNTEEWLGGYGLLVLVFGVSLGSVGGFFLIRYLLKRKKAGGGSILKWRK